MTTNERYLNDRDFVVHSTASVFGAVRTLVRVFFWLAGLLMVGCVIFALGEALWQDPVDFLSFWGPVAAVIFVAGWIRARWERKHVKALPREEHQKRMAAIYAANEAQRAKEFPDIVFAENEAKWRKELAA